MICDECKRGIHVNCVAKKGELILSGLPSTGLSPEGDKVQKSGLCPCQHRVIFSGKQVSINLANPDAAVAVAISE